MKNKFMLGVNYWASNAGTKMWQEFDASIIEKDLKALSSNGVNTVRLFPLWPDFQPISAIHVCGGVFQEVAYKGDQSLPFTTAGQNGVDEEMCCKMDIVLDLALKYNIDIIMGLLTGWMSGRMFTPPAFEGKKLVTDAFAVKWEIKYVSYIVSRFKDHKSVISWDLGNECNCLQFDITADESYVWCANISNAIKKMDNTRPIISGLNCIHGKNSDTPFSPKILGETTDILCTHPYPYFYDQCLNGDSISFRSLMHSSCDTLLHTNLSGKPAFVEEIGTLGPMYCDEQRAGVFARINMYESLSQGFPGFLWWCGFDLNHLQFPPYDWFMWENELGVMIDNKTPKPIISEMKSFASFIKTHNLEKLPTSTKHAVCILSKEQSIWTIAYGTYMLARQAGFNLQFCYANDEIPISDLYILPSITGGEPIYKRCFQEVLKRVSKDGASLYISMDKKAFMSNFNVVTGVTINNVSERASKFEFEISNESYSLNYDYIYDTFPTTAKTLISSKVERSISQNMQIKDKIAQTHFVANVQHSEQVVAESLGVACANKPKCKESTVNNEAPFNLMYENQYGIGKIYTLLIPIEKIACESTDLISDEYAMPLFEIYNLFKPKTIANKTCKNVAINEQVIRDEILVTLVNAGESCYESVTIDSDYEIDRILLPEALCKATNNSLQCNLTKGDICMFYIKKK